MPALAILATLFTIETLTTDGCVTKATRDVPEENGIIRFVWPKSALPANVKRVSVEPDFAWARTGEKGYWVFPNNHYGTFRLSNAATYRESWSIYMPMFGFKSPRVTYCAIVTGMPYSLSLQMSVRNGVYHQTAQFDRAKDEFYEDIVIEYHLLKGDDADYSGMGRCYRKYQLDRGACRPIAVRAKENPLLDYALQNPEVRIRQAWKPVPSPVAEQVTRNEPAVKAAVTFDRFKEIVDESVRQGVKGAEFCLVGWNVGGHDGRYPQIFPVEPALGGEEKMKEAIAYAQAKGYQVVGHSSFRDCYMIADTWDAEYVVEKNPDGTLKQGKTTWGGGRLYTMCPQRAYERFCPKQCAEMATLGFKGLFYIDVTTSRTLFPCKDPRHPLNNAQRCVWENNILRELQRTFGGSASEGGYDFCVGTCDSALTVQWVKPFEPPRLEIIDGYVPLWQIVYHGIILSTPFRTGINCPANPDRRQGLKLAEFGGRPTFYWHSWFVSHNKPSMGTWDLVATTDDSMRQGVTWMKEGYDEYARRRDLQYAFMDRHETLCAGVVRVTYSNGARMLVNYNAQPENIDGQQVPACDYVVVR